MNAHVPANDPNFLTPGNSVFSGPRAGEGDARLSRRSDEIECSQIGHLEYREYIQHSVARSTHDAYAADIKRFLEWGGTIPASPEIVASYLADHARDLSGATLARRLASIGKAHASNGSLNPTAHPLVRATMRGIRRVHARPVKQAAPLLAADIAEMMSILGDRTKDIRDRALLLVGFAGALRRSELVALTSEDIDWHPQKITVTIRRSKTDPFGKARQVIIPKSSNSLCPAAALRDWLREAGISSGPIFRGVDRHGNVLSRPISGQAVALIIKERAAALAGEPSRYTGHSLRAGFATTAALAGRSAWDIRQQTGHHSDAMVSRYIRLHGCDGKNSVSLL